MQATLLREVGVGFDPGRPFQIRISGADIEPEPYPPSVLPFLHAERARTDLANLEDIFRSIVRGLRDVRVSVLVETGYPGQLGAREIAVWIVAELLAQEANARKLSWRLLEIDLADDSTCSDPPALLTRIASVPGKTDGVDVEETGWGSPENARQRLRESLEGTGPVILLLGNAHEFPKSSRQFVARCLVPLACEGGLLRLIMTTESIGDLLLQAQSSGQVCVTDVPKVSRNDLLEFLNRHTLYDVSLRERMLGVQDAFTQAEAMKFAEMLASRRHAVHD